MVIKVHLFNRTGKENINMIYHNLIVWNLNIAVLKINTYEN